MDYWGGIDSPRLTKEEEVAAFERGDKDLMVRSIFPWVIKVCNGVCKKYRFKDRELALSAGMCAVAQMLDGRFDPAKGSLTTYCTKVVYWAVENEIKREMRVRDRNVPYTDLTDKTEDFWACAFKDDHSHFDNRDTCEVLLGYAYWLTDSQREVLQMRMDGYSFNEIAAHRDCTDVSARLLFGKAMDSIRESLEIDGIQEQIEEAVK